MLQILPSMLALCLINRYTYVLCQKLCWHNRSNNRLRQTYIASSGPFACTLCSGCDSSPGLLFTWCGSLIVHEKLESQEDIELMIMNHWLRISKLIAVQYKLLYMINKVMIGGCVCAWMRTCYSVPRHLVITEHSQQSQVRNGRVTCLWILLYRLLHVNYAQVKGRIIR